MKIRKAVIPAAGFGTRLFPATKSIKKELFPIIDKDGRAKPVIQIIVEEAIQAGIKEVGIVVQTSDRTLFTDFFKSPPKPALLQKLSPQSEMITSINHITLAVKNLEESFGFYQDILGFKPIAKWKKGAYFLAGDLWFCIIQDKNISTS